MIAVFRIGVDLVETGERFAADFLIAQGLLRIGDGIVHRIFNHQFALFCFHFIGGGGLVAFGNLVGVELDLRLDGIEILLARCHAAGLRLLGLGGFAVQVIIAALLYYRIALLRFHYLGVRGVGLIHDFLLVAVIV